MPGKQQTTSMTSVFDFKEDDTPEWRLRVSKFIDAWPMTLFFMGVTIWALFGDDLRLAVFPPAADPFFVGLTYFMLVAFASEMSEDLTTNLLPYYDYCLLLSLVKRGYMFSFYFWLDFIATASLLFDIPAVNEAILATSSDTADSTTLARAGRTSRVGTRAGRIARVVRVIRLVRMLKIYKVLSAHLARISQRNSKISEVEVRDEDTDEE
eukprot:scaffold646169_cov48-Prasinocladus_malaysianus.AAC.1